MKKTLPAHNHGSIQQELLRALRYHRPLSLLAVTAEYSTTPSLMAAGTRFPDLIKKHLRNTDIVAEDFDTRFFLLLPETSIEGCYVLANRLVKDILTPDGILKTLHIGISAIDEGVYRADDLINMAILSNMAARTAGMTIFSISNFHDKSLSLPSMVAVILNMSSEEIEDLSAFFERTRHEPEGIRRSSSELVIKLSKKLKIEEDVQEILRFWILMHDLSRNTTSAREPEQNLPHLSRRKKAFHTSLMHYAYPDTHQGKIDSKGQALLEIFQGVLKDIGAYHNPTEEIFSEILRKVLTTSENAGTDKQVIALVRKTTPSEWFSYPT